MSKKSAVLHCKLPNTEKVHLLDASEILNNNEICCPPVDDCLWSSHPRVFLKLDDKGEAQCPYCDTVYKLQTKTASE
jgi:uncharacterized Zn-finger protein